jgi:hypothetical protein
VLNTGGPSCDCSAAAFVSESMILCPPRWAPDLHNARRGEDAPAPSRSFNAPPVLLHHQMSHHAHPLGRINESSAIRRGCEHRLNAPSDQQPIGHAGTTVPAQLAPCDGRS